MLANNFVQFEQLGPDKFFFSSTKTYVVSAH